MDPAEFFKKVGVPAEATELGFSKPFPSFGSKEVNNKAIAPNVSRMREFFSARNKGPGIWKWLHYFEIYERHFSKFRDQEVHILEIGLFSGGSLDLWRDYFGPKCHIYGVDISPRCKAHERDGVKVFIGNQSDASFWTEFRKAVPRLDIVVDDGSHEPYDQAVSVEQLLPHISPGGVYLMEDLTGAEEKMNAGAAYVHGLAHRLNGRAGAVRNDHDPKRFVSVTTTPFQRAVGSVHFYPFVAIIERNSSDVNELISSKQGTVWEPPAFWDDANSAKKEAEAKS